MPDRNLNLFFSLAQEDFYQANSKMCLIKVFEKAWRKFLHHLPLE